MFSVPLIIILSLVLVSVIGLYLDWNYVKAVIDYQKDVMSYNELVMKCDEISSKLNKSNLNCVAIALGWYCGWIVFKICLYFKISIGRLIHTVMFLIKIVLDLY